MFFTIRNRIRDGEQLVEDDLLLEQPVRSIQLIAT